MTLSQRRHVKLSLTMLVLITVSTYAISARRPTRVAALPALEHDVPVVFVDPPFSIAEPGDTVTISVKIFNLSDTFILTNEPWYPGDPPPVHNPDAILFNYSLGNLYGLDIGFTWDSTVLEYVNHTATIPVDTYPEGILHDPIIDIKNVVNETHEISLAPTPDTHYWLAQTSQYPAEPFNAPGANATVFTVTFSVKKNGVSALNFTGVDLGTVDGPIPCRVKQGYFHTRKLATRIAALTLHAEANDTLYSCPVIAGENATVHVTMCNDNLTQADTYNLTMQYDGVQLPDGAWENRVLDPGASETLEVRIKSPAVALHNVTAEATIAHGSTPILDELTAPFAAIATPALAIHGPTSASPGQTIAFTAAGSQHTDPRGQITNYRWSLWAAGETAPRDIQIGQSVEFQVPQKTLQLGDWTVMLVVTDNYGITAEPLPGNILTPNGSLRRPSTTPYRATATVAIHIPAEATIESCNPAGDTQDSFDVGEAVYVTGGGYAPNTTYPLYIVTDVTTWSDGMPLPTRVPDTAFNITVSIDDTILPTLVWSDPQALGKYDIVVDVNGNGVYDISIDALDDSDVEVTAGFIIPEFPATLLPLVLLLAMLARILANRHRSARTPP